MPKQKEIIAPTINREVFKMKKLFKWILAKDEKKRKKYGYHTKTTKGFMKKFINQ